MRHGASQHDFFQTVMTNKYPIGIQNFESLRNDGYVYVDKTALMYKLASSGRHYFLGRPRRFGKSLLLSTLEAYFQGKRELFKGLAVESLEKDWTVYPVLHLDLNAKKFDAASDLIRLIDRQLLVYEDIYGKNDTDETIDDRFVSLIRSAHDKTGQRVVVLVDEYEKPILQAIGRPDLQKEYKDTLKAFYGVLKSMDGYVRFAMLTGVTKFGKTSVFSDLNNLNDISMNSDYSTICGITETELHTYFDADLHELGDKLGMKYEEVCAETCKKYDGYHFTEDSPGIYNPFSVLNMFYAKKFDDYWFATGTPSYLVELLQRFDFNLENLTDESVTADALDDVDTPETSPIPIIYQSGYLTIKGYEPEFRQYRLGFPNSEVESGFVRYLLPHYANTRRETSTFSIQNFVRDVENGDVDDFMTRLKSLFADTPYEHVIGQRKALNTELHFHNVLYIAFKLLGFHTEVEYHTSKGRIDLVVKTPKYIYVMEFKLDGTAEQALRQIDDKGYAEPFKADGRKLVKLGVNFSTKTRSIERWMTSDK